MDLVEATTRLYGLAPELFLADRTELVAQARAAKDRDLAREIGQLRRPTRTAWLLNLLTRDNPDQLGELLELRASFARAQREGDGIQLRALSRQRRELITELTQVALTLGRDAGYSAPDGAIQEIGQTLEAALADPRIRDQLLAGALTKPVRYGGFGIEPPDPLTAPSLLKTGSASDPDDLMALLGARVSTDRTATPASDQPANKGPGTGTVRAQRERRAAQERRAEQQRLALERAQQERRQAAAQQTRIAAEQAENTAAEAEAAADALALRSESLRDEWRAAEEAACSAAEIAAAARETADKLRDLATAAADARTV